jgi:ABC-2 type transport system permease protein
VAAAQGTLETLIVSPGAVRPRARPLTLATSTMGVYSIAATLLWGRLLFDVPLELVIRSPSRSACPWP